MLALPWSHIMRHAMYTRWCLPRHKRTAEQHGNGREGSRGRQRGEKDFDGSRRDDWEVWRDGKFWVDEKLSTSLNVWTCTCVCMHTHTHTQKRAFLQKRTLGYKPRGQAAWILTVPSCLRHFSSQSFFCLKSGHLQTSASKECWFWAHNDRS